MRTLNPCCVVGSARILCGMWKLAYASHACCMPSQCRSAFYAFYSSGPCLLLHNCGSCTQSCEFPSFLRGQAAQAQKGAVLQYILPCTSPYLSHFSPFSHTCHRTQGPQAQDTLLESIKNSTAKPKKTGLLKAVSHTCHLWCHSCLQCFDGISATVCNLIPAAVTCHLAKSINCSCPH